MDYMADFVDETVSTPYGMMHYRIHRSVGKCMVFLHGFGATTRVWSRLLECMPGSQTVCLVDLMGHGSSDAPDIDYTVKMQAEAVGALVQSLKLKNIYLVGHSYGGWVAAYYAIGKTLGGLVLIDAGGPKEQFENRPPGRTLEEEKRMLLKAALSMNKNNERVMRSVLDNSTEFQLDGPALGGISARTLIVWGENDTLIPLSCAHAFKNGIPDSRLSIVGGAKHEPHYTNAKEVCGLLEQFISE